MKCKNILELYSFLKIDKKISNKIENFQSYVNRKKINTSKITALHNFIAVFVYVMLKTFVERKEF